jgi:hypothetical protein
MAHRVPPLPRRNRAESMTIGIPLAVCPADALSGSRNRPQLVRRATPCRYRPMTTSLVVDPGCTPLSGGSHRTAWEVPATPISSGRPILDRLAIEVWSPLVNIISQLACVSSPFFAMHPFIWYDGSTYPWTSVLVKAGLTKYAC